MRLKSQMVSQIVCFWCVSGLAGFKYTIIFARVRFVKLQNSINSSF